MPASKSKSKSKSKSSKTKCGKGEIYRKGYTRTKGSKTIRVKGNCIKATSQSGLKRSVADEEYFEKQAKRQARARSLTNGSKSCPKGEILRVAYERGPYRRRAYTRSDGTHVKGAVVGTTEVGSTCIKDLGRPGHGKQLFHLEKGVLEKYGYEDVRDKTKLERHRALNRALKEIKPLPLFRRINALYVLNENKDSNLAEIFKEDRDYIKTTDAYMSRATAPKKSKSKSSKSKSSKSKSSKSKSKSSKSKSKSKNKSKKKSKSKSKSKA